MKKLLIFLLLISTCCAAQIIQMPRTSGIGPGFAPMQKSIPAIPVPGWGSATYALSLDGIDDYAISGVNTPAGQAAFTLMCWYYDAAPTAALTTPLYYANFGYVLGYPSSGVGLVGNNAAWQVINPGTRASTWRHISIVRKGSALPDSALASAVVYIDGTETNQLAGSYEQTISFFVNTLPIKVGRYGYSGYDWFFKGKIAEIAIFNAALTPSQIQGYYLKRLTGTEPNLVRLYHCDEGTGTSIADACGSGDPLSCYNGASLGATWVSR